MSNIKFMPCHSTNYATGRTKKIKYLVIHYTANNGDTAENNGNYFANKENLASSAHYFVDESDTIVQSVNDTDTAWHCGATRYKHPECRNANSIGIELCSRKDSEGNYYFKDEVVTNAITLTRELMQKYSIDTDHVIRHYDVMGKNCPAPFVADSTKWDKFKNNLLKNDLTEDTEMNEKLIELENKIAALQDRVAELETNSNEFVYAWVDENMPEWARPTIQKLMDKGYLKGDEEGKLNLKMSEIRILVVLDRAGAFGE